MKKITHFTIQFRSIKTSLILRISTHLKLKIICSQNTAKKFSQFTNFPAKMFLFGARKNICTTLLPYAQELLSWSTLKANVCIFLQISLRKCLLQRLSNILSCGMRGEERLNNLLKVARCLGLVKYFAIFQIIWNFSKFNYFSVLNTFSNSNEALKFSRQFGLQR